MYFFIYDFTVQYFEGVQMNAFVEGEDGVADGRVVGQAEVFL